MRGKNMEIITRKLSEIKPYEKNPRKNDAAVEYVANSIKEFGFKVPIVIDKDGVIVAGHTRYKASKKLKLTEVPCIIADDLTPEQIKAYRLADNRVAEKSEWDIDLLSGELDDILNIDMAQFDFDLSENVEESEVVEDDFDVELPEEPKAKLGDIYQLGNHRLMCGDSTSIDNVEKLMNGNKVSLLLTDPPYNVNYEGSAGKIMNDKMDNDSFRQFLRDAFTAADVVMNDGAVFYIWHADSEGYNFRGACFDVGWKVRQCLIWVKSSLVLGRQDYQWKHEPCLYGWKDGEAHYWKGGRKERTTITGFDLFELRDKNKEDLLKFIEKQWCDSEEEETTIIYEDKPHRNGEHPTMKPIKLLSRQVTNSSKKEDIVLDMFGGSGSTLIACEQLERNCYMMEFDPKYVDVIINRWEQFTGKQAVLLSENITE
jgi:DNA modification methylase